MALIKQTIMSKRSNISHAATGIFLLAALGFIYCFLFVPPSVPIFGGDLGYGDASLYLAPGQRMYQGEMIYRDFFEFVTPGTAVVNFLMFKLFGLKPWIPCLLVLLLGLGMIWFSVAISRKLMSAYLVLLPGSLFLISVRKYLCDPTHHWYSALAAIAAVAVLLEGRTPARIAATGFFCGISACFTQTRGLAAVVGFAVFLIWESRQRQGSLCGLLSELVRLFTSFFATFLAVNAYFIWKAGLARYLWCTVVFVIKYYPREADWNTFRAVTMDFPPSASLRTFLPEFGNWLFLVIGTPLLFVLFFARYWRGRAKKPLEYWERPMLVAIVGLFMLLSIAPAPNPNRMAVSALPALILLGWFLDSPRKYARTLTVVLALGTLQIAVRSVARLRPDPAGILATSQGKVAFIDPDKYQEYIWIQQHTQRWEYFYDADFSDLYFYLDLRNPTPLPRIVANGYTTLEQVASVIQGLEHHKVQYIFWALDDPDKYGVVVDPSNIPKWESPSDFHLKQLRIYIRHHYKLVKVFENSDEVWERAPR